MSLLRIARWSRWARKIRALRREGRVLYLACRHPRTPWYAKALAVSVAVYAISPIDIIPDFIPVIGHVDDLIVIPLGLAVARWLIPREVIAECRARAGAPDAG